MKSSLVTYSYADLLFLPVLELNQGTGLASSAALNPTTSTFLLTANSSTETTVGLLINNKQDKGLLLGNQTSANDNRFIKIDQVLPIAGADEGITGSQ